MKAVGKGTNRGAEVHIYVDGKVLARQEYREYTDLKDKAKCCYVPVEEGHKTRFGGKFSGTTLAIAYDAIVDGVYRKAGSYVAKTVNYQANKKINVETFFHRTDKNIIDTNMLVAPLVRVTTSQGDASETIVTMELRVYITGQLDVAHSIGNVERYYAPKGTIEDDTKPTANYSNIVPTLEMRFERNCAPMEKMKANSVIDEHDLDLTFDPSSKGKTEPHVLVHEPVPPFLSGTKLRKNDGATSTRASSPMPQKTACTPFSEAQSTPKSSAPVEKKLGPKSKPKPKPAPIMTSTTEKEPTTSPESSPNPEPQEDVNENLLSKVFPKPAEKPPAMKATVPESAETATNKPADKKISDKPVEKEPAAANDTTTVSIPEGVFSGSTVESATKTTSLPDPGAKFTNSTTENSTTQVPEIVKRPTRPTHTAIKKPIGKLTTTLSGQKKAVTPLATNKPTKRPAAATNGTTPDPKRSKIFPEPFVPSTQPNVPRITPRSPTPKTASIERQLAEQRKKLEALRKKPQEIAKKQATVDEQMTPYKQRMFEELERLDRGMTEEEQQYKASVDILEEFKNADDGV
ncbi:hypothetical protein EJ02DRAFT_419452 [Clathrospora elynae]|uniref:Uncharacterized protein n=1 Tax=Clathrospora elynae TaxID=706981 RepID=A0A6A5SXS2_9PLEO|nr:hypothetical protein EJ02DRAFT_419452 [Clathrospora elynae]